MDWFDDAQLEGEIRRMNPAQRHKAAFLALRRLQGPLLGLPMPEEWGIRAEVVAAILQAGSARLDGAVDRDLHRAIEALLSADLFEDGNEVHPEGNEEFQLDVLSAWISLEESLGDMDEETIYDILMRVRQLANATDVVVDQSLSVLEGEGDHRDYILGVGGSLSAYGLGYFGTRNIELEQKCNSAILSFEGDGWGGSEVGREALGLCDEFGQEVLSVLIRTSTF
ncbi:hypothetical protein [Streptomyces sp. NPDC093600]|uniref:hypothetical protein n=1 Tax=Streptomyces sp. NPDC093600 TaxID=3366047 RepID=UPI00382A1EB5